MSGEGDASGDSRIVEAEFAVTDSSWHFVRLAAIEDCRVELEELLPRGEGRTAEYFSVTGGDPEAALDLADRDEIVDARLHVRDESGGLFEYVVEGNCPVRYLVECGAVPISVYGTPCGGTIVAELLPGGHQPDVISGFLDVHDAELVAKRRKEGPSQLFSERELRRAVLDRLTARQREVLFDAFDAGYYERPRETTGEDLADELGITPPTLQQHRRAAERKIVGYLAEERIDEPGE